MANDFYAKINDKGYSKRGYQKYIGELVNNNLITRLKKHGFTVKQISEIADLSESHVIKICDELGI